MTLLSPNDYTSCRACGAVRAARVDDDNDGLELGVCQTCWNSFNRWRNSNGDPTEDEFNQWLARKLFLDLRRLHQTGIIGRCEAVSDWLYGNRGKQCASSAITRRNGRLVCGRHLTATAPAFVEDAGRDHPYRVLGEIVRRLARVDKLFRDTLKDALSG